MTIGQDRQYMGKLLPRSFERIRSGEQIVNPSFTNVAAANAAGITAAKFPKRIIYLSAGGTGGIPCLAVSDGTNWKQVAIGVNAKAAGQRDSPHLIAGNVGVFDGFYPFVDSYLKIRNGPLASFPPVRLLAESGQLMDNKPADNNQADANSTNNDAYSGMLFMENGEGLGVTPTQNYFLIKIRVTNLNPDKTVDFSTWRSGSIWDKSGATLCDNFGNAYKRIVFDRPLMNCRDESTIYPNQSFTDTLIFEFPVQNYQWLHLSLDANNFGGSGTLRFEISN